MSSYPAILANKTSLVSRQKHPEALGCQVLGLALTVVVIWGIPSWAGGSGLLTRVQFLGAWGLYPERGTREDPGR